MSINSPRNVSSYISGHAGRMTAGEETWLTVQHNHSTDYPKNTAASAHSR